MNSRTIRGVWFAIAVLAAAGIGTVAGLLSSRDGGTLAAAVGVSAGAFGATLALEIVALEFFLD